MPIDTAPTTISEVLPEFLLFAQVELQFADQSLIKYRDCLLQIERIVGPREVSSVSEADVLAVKASLIRKRLSVSRQVSLLCALKRLLQFWRLRYGPTQVNPQQITMPRRPRRHVEYLTTEEVERFVTAIRVTSVRDHPLFSALRFRALVEALLGSGMRIGELLALNHADIDWERAEARVIGKGNKQRTVFFTHRALAWLRSYLDVRRDQHPALFVCQDGQSRLSRTDIWRPFARYRNRAGIRKRVTPHLLRHTAATQLLFNGCPIGHIKEILGHERLETTCRYYLGLDSRAAKEALKKYLTYASGGEGTSVG